MAYTREPEREALLPKDALLVRNRHSQPSQRSTSSSKHGAFRIANLAFTMLSFAVVALFVFKLITALAVGRGVPGVDFPPAPQASIAASRHIDYNIPGSALSLSGDEGWHFEPSETSRTHASALGNDSSCRQIQHRFPHETNSPASTNGQRAEAIKQAYVDAWDAYYKYAYPKDTLMPISHTGRDGSFVWSLTVIDGIDTAIIMGLKDIVDVQLAHIAEIDFSGTPELINGFDTTIRYLGGLLSAYDTITSGLVPHASHYNKKHVEACLAGAKTLADVLAPLFDTRSGLPRYFINTTTHETSNGPFPYVDPDTGKVNWDVTNTAIAGTIILEYHRLSDLTGDESYRRMADRAEQNLISPKPKPTYPGLVGGTVDLNTGEFLTKDAGWKSGVDSFYEYLIKSYIYDPRAATADPYLDFWITAVESTIKYLAVHPYHTPSLTFITELNNTGSPLWRMDDYACFAGGNFLLGGAYLGRQDFIELGLAVSDSCHKTFNTTASGLNPLSFAWYGPDNKTYDPQFNGDDDVGRRARAYFDENGYIVDRPLYTLFPEPIESNYYAYRITGDVIWQEYNWEIFQAFTQAGKRNGAVMSSVWNVSAPLGGDQWDDLPSYYYAETLKYMYLTFSDPDLISLDDFQFNTEAHPIRVQHGTCSTT